MAKYDLVVIEADYRADQLSNRAISTKYGCSEASIRKWAIKYGWQKDLSAKVKTATKVKLTKAVAETTTKAKERKQDEPLSDEEIVEEASNVAVDIITSHRARASEYQSIVQGYGQRLKEQIIKGTVSVQNRDGEIVEIDLPLEYVGKCINSATQSLERLVKIERQAYNLDEQTDSSYEDDLEALAEGL